MFVNEHLLLNGSVMLEFNERQKSIVEQLRHKGFLSIDELVALFDVTPQTIRRDLNTLAEAGLIQRHHGGAAMASDSVNDSYQTRQIKNRAAKERIAAHIAGMIPNGSSLFINIGTTNECVARALLNHRDLSIVTNNIHVASILSTREDFKVIIAAGEVRHRDGGIIGEATRDFISQFHMDFGIVSISAISEEGALLDYDFREVKVAQAILEHSRTVILAADHSKFGRNAMVRQGDITQVDHLITDAQPPAQVRARLKEHSVNCHVCLPQADEFAS